ncbi:MAG: DUF222 domain-containing protein [Gammaproteobacteria bacterium]|nr:DUF222 domain-containing protein [Gammaproteobacteria bacterium]
MPATTRENDPWKREVIVDGSSSTSSADGASPSPADGASPSDEHDELHQLGERIADLAASINAAEGRMMALLADFDRRGGWKDDFGSCAEWLAWRTGIKIGPARERVRAARALEDLPRTAEALRRGRLSYAKVRAITRVATPESESKLLEFARTASAARLEQRVRMWKQLSREGELTAEQVRHRNRALSVFVDGDGMYVIRGRLEPEVGAVLRRALEAAADALYRREERVGEGGRQDGRAESRMGTEASAREGARAWDAAPTPKQRWADAAGLMAERALAAGFGEDSEEGTDESGTRAERYQVVIHTEAATLAEEGEPGRSDLDGVRVAAEISRRMACDAAVVEMVHGKPEALRGKPETVHGKSETVQGNAGMTRGTANPMHGQAPSVSDMATRGPRAGGQVLSVGRKTRTVPPHIRRALEERDRGCRFPGCASRFTEAHHVRHWADGGETRLSNLLLLCRRHHRAVHEGRVRVCTDRAGLALFFTRKGRAMADAPEATGMIGSGARANLPAVASSPFSNGAGRYRDSDVPWAIEAAAREAVEETL